LYRVEKRGLQGDCLTCGSGCWGWLGARGGLQARVGGICVNPDRHYVLGFVALAQPMLFKLE